MTAPRPAQSPPTLNRAGSTPLYVQLATTLRDKIEHGEWRPGQRIPSENELNRAYGISRMTARQVLAQLVSEQLIFRVPGKGTFVTPRRADARPPAYIGIRKQLERAGDPAAGLPSPEIVPADTDVSQHKRIPLDAPVHRLRRRRVVPASRSACTSPTCPPSSSST